MKGWKFDPRDRQFGYGGRHIASESYISHKSSTKKVPIMTHTNTSPKYTETLCLEGYIIETIGNTYLTFHAHFDLSS